jgi:hypothetical protein
MQITWFPHPFHSQSPGCKRGWLAQVCRAGYGCLVLVLCSGNKQKHSFAFISATYFFVNFQGLLLVLWRFLKITYCFCCMDTNSYLLLFTTAFFLHCLLFLQYFFLICGGPCLLCYKASWCLVTLPVVEVSVANGSPVLAITGSPPSITRHPWEPLSIHIFSSPLGCTLSSTRVPQGIVESNGEKWLRWGRTRTLECRVHSCSS